ncbi:MAG: tetratricopeptide repeat protein, partial [Candidatus Njordarchaeota archaeon]
MKSLDWLLHLLEGNLDTAQDILAGESIKDQANVMNLLAVNFLKRNFDKIKKISKETLKRRKDIREDFLVKVLEYRILADIATDDVEDLLSSFRFLRPKLLMFIARMAPTIVVSSVQDLLNEQTLILLRRLRQNIIEDYDPYTISRVVCKAILEVAQNGFFDRLNKEERAEALAYASMLLLVISKVNVAKALLKRSLSLHESYINRCALGKLYFVIGNFAQAFSELNYALTLAETDKYKGFEARTNIAQLYAIQGDYKMALKYIID